jgi:hypothetical protein
MPEESKDYELFAAETTRNRRNPGKSDWRKENWMRTQAEKGTTFARSMNGTVHLSSPIRGMLARRGYWLISA